MSGTVSPVLGLITGSGFYDVPAIVDRTTSEVETPYGPVNLTSGRWGEIPVAFLPRHGSGHSIAPHAINYRANVWALAAAEVQAIIATAVSGGISEAMEPGALVSISDYIDFTSGREWTFFDGRIESGLGRDDSTVTHTDMTNPYHPGVRALLRQAAADVDVSLIDGGVYCTTNGPRFETPAEIAMMAAAGGDLVGMTGYPEVALAREAGVPYASIGVISNRAAGLGDDELSVADIFAVIEGAGDRLYRLIERALQLSAAGIPQ